MKGKTVKAPAIRAVENGTKSLSQTLREKHVAAATAEAKICQEANGI
jgi:hypothetical protein